MTMRSQPLLPVPAATVAAVQAAFLKWWNVLLTLEIAIGFGLVA